MNTVTRLELSNDEPVRVDAGAFGTVELVVGEFRFGPDTTRRIAKALNLQTLGEVLVAEAHEAKGPVPARSINPGDYVLVPLGVGDGADHTGEWWTVRNALHSAGRTLLVFGEGELMFDVCVDSDHPVKYGQRA